MTTRVRSAPFRVTDLLVWLGHLPGPLREEARARAWVLGVILWEEGRRPWLRPWIWRRWGRVFGFLFRRVRTGRCCQSPPCWMRGGKSVEEWVGCLGMVESGEVLGVESEVERGNVMTKRQQGGGA